MPRAACGTPLRIPAVPKSLLVLALAQAVQLGAAAQPGIIQVEPLLLMTQESSRAAVPPPLKLAEGLSIDPVRRLARADTGALDSLLQMQEWNRTGRTPMMNGFARSLARPLHGAFGSSRSPIAVADGWQARTVDDRQVFGTSIQVEGAWRLRARLDSVRLPPGSELWVWGLGTEPVSFGLELRDDAGGLWTPSVDGEILFVEVAAPTNAAEFESGPFFQVSEVMQLFAPEVPESGECLVDATCIGAGTFDAIDAARGAIAQLQYVKGSGSYVCTGGLLNDTDTSTTIPYLLTANHCFSSQASASSLEAYWDYRSSTCGGSWPSFGSLPLSSGATLLATSVLTDFTLVRLNSIPAGRYLLGWTTAGVSNGTSLHRVSHPFPPGFSDPFAQTYSRTAAASAPVLTCATDEDGRPWGDLTKFLYSSTAQGGAYGGSSGSPVILAGGYVVGQLLGACGTNLEGCSPDHYTVDGRFAVTYPSISQYLSPQPAGSPCVPGPSTLCIDNNPGDKRFKVEVYYNSVLNGGISGYGNAIPLASVGVAKGGLFWFFGADNPEMMIKVLNGCGYNNHFWLFASAGTNLGLTATITDTIGSGPPFVITNPDLHPVDSVATIEAFPCP